MIFFPSVNRHMVIAAEEMHLFATQPPPPLKPYFSFHSRAFYSQQPPFNSSKESTPYLPQHPVFCSSQQGTPNSSQDSTFYPQLYSDLYSSQQSTFNSSQGSDFGSPQEPAFFASQDSQVSSPYSAPQFSFNSSQDSTFTSTQDSISIPPYGSMPNSARQSAFDSSQAASNSSPYRGVKGPSTTPRFHFVCTGSKDCTRSFKRRWNLKEHMRKHSDERPFICRVPGCNRSYKWRSSRKHHSDLHERKRAQQTTPGPLANATSISIPEATDPSIKTEDPEIHPRLSALPPNIISPPLHAYNPEDLDEILDEILVEPPPSIL